MTCDICEIFKHKEIFKVVYEDDLCMAILHESPANYGHILVIPKDHFTIMDLVPDKIIEHLFSIANLISTALFESLNLQGTNIIVNNGVEAGQKDPHFTIDVIPRTENDGINFDWKAEPANEDSLKTAELKLKQFTDKLGVQEVKKEPINVQENIEQVDDEDYMFKQLRKIP
jgi:histidine triad (HIT) family protein